ncbi:MAG: PAS domain S-box protein, partial [Deltaproteobacteria bacterium]|nr:PAS domain S-box protein [Deltaproteobacteria bacterium]
LVEKGAALIRSFEAGARTGMMGMGWGTLQVERLLVETARQSDILYLVVTDEQGITLAHSDPSQVGKRHPTAEPRGPASAEALEALETVKFRQVQTEEGELSFEVYKRFMPVRGNESRRGLDRLGMNMLRPPPPQDEENRRFETREKKQGDWCRFYWDRRERIFRPAHFIFVGLDMGALESARVEARRRTILMSGGVVLIALAGTLSLFLAQGYRLTRRSLAKVRAFSDQVVENLPVGLVATDELGRVAAFNETAETILAVPSHRVLDGAAAQALPPELWALSERIDRQGAIIEEDLECQTVRQSSLPLRVSAAGLRGENSAFLGYVFIFRDLTEVRRLEQEVERSRRLAAIGNLAAGVAHEIRNPLSSIKGFATYFRERFKDEPQDQNTADTMIQEVERLDRVIGQLLEFARPSGLKIRPVRVDELIEHSLRLVESDARTGGVEVTSTVPADLSPIAMDADRMNQVLLNLYLNAIQAMNKGGTLGVEVTRDEQSKQTRITVADTGPGIDPSDQERIFDPYFTTKPAGTGLGLAIVHKIMEAHGGDVDVYSASNTGTMVTLILPDMTEDEHAGCAQQTGYYSGR